MPVDVDPSDLLAARWTMALSLGSHIVLSCLGVALPLVIYLAHRRGLRHDDPDALALARRLGKAAGVLFAVGAVSGTILSFEMGVLWPGLMDRFGAVIGLPFALEGIFFFLEAIFIGVYLYGWDRLPARVHLATLIPITLAGVGGTLCIMAVNGWMNHPHGFDIEHYLTTGEVTGVDPWAAMFNPALRTEFLHMLSAAYVVAAFLTAAVYANGWRKGRRDGLHRLGVRIPLTIASIAVPLQVLTGDMAIRYIAAEQPTKMAAAELVTETGGNQPLTLGGLLVDGEVKGAIEVPDALSLLLHFDRAGVVQGLDAVPADERPPVNVVHLSFEVMVGLGTAMLLLAVVVGWRGWRRRRRGIPDEPEGWEHPWVVRGVIAAAPASILALEAGWTTTEVGRQPWIARGVMRVSESVTPNDGIPWVLLALIAIYLGMGTSAVLILRGMSRRWRQGQEVHAPYEPVPPPDEAGAATSVPEESPV